MQDYSVAASTYSWAQPGLPNRHRLYLDVYNVTDFFLMPKNGGPGSGFADHTVLADTHPSLPRRFSGTIVFRIQIGLNCGKKKKKSVWE